MVVKFVEITKQSSCLLNQVVIRRTLLSNHGRQTTSCCIISITLMAAGDDLSRSLSDVL